MEPTIFVLDNAIQNYAWGSRQAISGLLGRSAPSSLPEAELWIGAHPKAPSRIVDPPGWGTLAEAIGRAPEAMLGRAVATRFGGLPYLFKVLAAAEPLSIQAHPSLAQAREGFARENRLGIPVEAPHRNYRDANHKPELVAALTPFVAANGFRPEAEIATAFAPITIPALEAPLARFVSNPGPEAVRGFFENLMSLDPRARATLIGRARSAAAERTEGSWSWFTRLDARYPGDLGALAPFFLNIVLLEPGEALYLPAGELHAYLEGTALEIMANSDNVLRGGLTPKHVDVPELVNTLSFRTGRPEILHAVPTGSSERTYRTPAPEFELSLVDIPRDGKVDLPGGSVFLGLEGEASLEVPGRSVRLSRGRTVFVPACLPSVGATGEARLARACVPA